MKIYVDVINQKLKINTSVKNLVSGSQEFVRFFFNLDSDWDNLAVFAQFQQNGNAYNSYLDEEKSVYLPSEIIEGKCVLTIYGTGGNVRATTNYLSLTIDKNTLVSNAQSVEISKTLYDQLINQISELVASPAGSGGDVGTELRNIRIGFDGTEYSSAGEAVRIQVDQAAQYRKGINALYSTYHSHIYEYTKEGTFYATQYDNSGGAIVRRWSDLPDEVSDFIIKNARYGDNWVLQTAVQASSPDIVYQRAVPRTEATGDYVWRRINCDLSGVQSQLDTVNGTIAALPQCREGINAQYATYNRHVYECKKDGTFYVTPANWDDLPTDDANYIITNSRYGSWIMQTAVNAIHADMVYRRFVSNNPNDDANNVSAYVWARVSCDLSGVQSQLDTVNGTIAALPQCREGINAQSATYNRHVYECKKDGTFYVTPANWDDLPTDDANYIITNSRYGSWIMQTAVKSADPATVYRRFISNNPADDQNASTFYTIAENNFGWEQCEGTDITKYSETAASDYLTVGLPILYLSGNTAEMSKSNAVTLSYQYGDTTGSCSVKWQGSSSIAYTKKNYTIKFDSALDVGWGSQKKYCFKANYVDNTNALNVCGARLWSQIVADRGTHAAITHNAPNNGAMDGFPCIIMLNGKFLGLYTWNIPKDIWAFGMGSGANEYIVTAEQHSDPTKFRTTTDFATDANDKALDFEIEYRPDAASDYDVKASINFMLDMVSTFDSRMWNYLDFGTAIDYMIFSALIANTDGVDKNFILTTYDGDKWFLNAYDLDSIMGNYWTGGKYYAPNGDDDNKTSFTWLAGTSRLFRILWENHKADVIARYKALRSDVLSEENVYMTLYNFCVRIPQVVIDEDNRKYPLKPGTSTETLSRIMEWYRMRCRYIDAEIQNASAN